MLRRSRPSLVSNDNRVGAVDGHCVYRRNGEHDGDTCQLQQNYTQRLLKDCHYCNASHEFFCRSADRKHGMQKLQAVATTDVSNQSGDWRSLDMNHELLLESELSMNPQEKVDSRIFCAAGSDENILDNVNERLSSSQQVQIISNTHKSGLSKTHCHESFEDELSGFVSCQGSKSQFTSNVKRSDSSLNNLVIHLGMASLSSFEEGYCAQDEIDWQVQDEQYNDNHTLSTKRKRYSNYMTPSSSYASLTFTGSVTNHHLSFNHELLNNIDSSSTITSIYDSDLASQNASSSIRSTTSPLQSRNDVHCNYSSSFVCLSEENILLISSFLRIRDIRSLSTTNLNIRSTLVASKGALKEIWMNVLKEKFPKIFNRLEETQQEKRIMLDSSQMIFRDELQLPMCGICHHMRDGFNINFPLLTGLLPNRYPQTIDPKTLNMSSDQHPFRTYKMSVSVKNVAGHENEIAGCKDVCPSAIVQVIQFIGQVGVGDRCIKSDMPFPSNAKCVPSDGKSSTGNFGRLSSLFRSHPQVNSMEQNLMIQSRMKSNGRVLGTFDDATIGSSSEKVMANILHPTTPPNRNSDKASHMDISTVSSLGINLSPLPFHRSSPLHFLSSMSSRLHKERPFSSTHIEEEIDRSIRSVLLEEDTVSSFYEFTNVEAYVGEEEEVSDNDRHRSNNGLLPLSFSKCKQRLGKFCQWDKSHCYAKIARPFVVPTVIIPKSHGNLNCHSAISSPGIKNSCESHLVIDLTPKSCAYFEVTIIEQTQDSLKAADNHQLFSARVIAPRLFPLHHEWNENPQWERQIHQHYLNRLRFPQRLRLSMHPLVVMALNHTGENQDRLFPVLPIAERNQNNRTLHHECVAIGLSTVAFSPRNKMPGWDEHSYGYHGDDGGSFHGRGDMIRKYGPSFGPGDTVGCGLNYKNNRIFFVKNGEFLGYVFDKVEDEVIEKGLYPTVGVDTGCPIFVNFGYQPFCFDLQSFAREGY